MRKPAKFRPDGKIRQTGILLHNPHYFWGDSLAGVAKAAGMLAEVSAFRPWLRERQADPLK